MARKATFPDVEDLDRIREIIARLIEEASGLSVHQ